MRHRSWSVSVRQTSFLKMPKIERIFMKLKSIETFTSQDVGFVRVTAEDGSQGWGQVSTYPVSYTHLTLPTILLL